MKLVVGLGNPGKEYENTRHNVGFMVLDSFVTGFSLEKKFEAMIKKEKIGMEDVLFVKPLTYMNLSGNSVRKVMDYYHIMVTDILVIQDDLDLKFGYFKLKEKSSSGGHNGIKSIISSLNSQDFCRLKIGISHEKSISTIDYVLQKFSKSEMDYFKNHMLEFQNIILSFIQDGSSITMRKYNRKGESHE